MREIKFRVWDGKEMFPINASFELEDGILDNGEGNIIMQYTGFHDKNGKEIYEGDIVREYLGKNIIPNYEIYRVGFGKHFRLDLRDDGGGDYIAGKEEVVGVYFESYDCIDMSGIGKEWRPHESIDIKKVK